MLNNDGRWRRQRRRRATTCPRLLLRGSSAALPMATVVVSKSPGDLRAIQQFYDFTIFIQRTRHTYTHIHTYIYVYKRFFFGCFGYLFVACSWQKNKKLYPIYICLGEFLELYFVYGNKHIGNLCKFCSGQSLW